MNSLLTRNALIGVGLILSCALQSGVAQSKRFKARATPNKEARLYTRNLPTIDKVELMKLRVVGDVWPGEIDANKFVEGSEAQAIAALWRTQVYRPESASCHNPNYAIRFYSKDKPIVYASLCWTCDNMDFIEPDLKAAQGFNGRAKKGQQLLKVFTTAFPLASTNPPVR